MDIIPGIRSADALSRPPGVAAERWIAVTDHLGFVVEQENVPASFPSNLPPSVVGHFMVRQKGRWLRLDNQSGVNVLPALLADSLHPAASAQP
jgi:hypothetical protein